MSFSAAEGDYLIAQYDFAPPDTLTDVEVEAVLAKADELAAWAEDVKEYAFNAALSGKEWQDWKLVEGRSVPALSALRSPLRDEDTERPDDEAYRNSYFILDEFVWNGNLASAALYILFNG